MVSEALTALADRFQRYDAEGRELHPVAVTLLVATFRDLAEQARCFENRPVPPHQRGELPAGVLPFRRRVA